MSGEREREGEDVGKGAITTTNTPFTIDTTFVAIVTKAEIAPNKQTNKQTCTHMHARTHP